jgi:hypothetical protein
VGRDTAPAKTSNKIGLYATAAGVVIAAALAAKLLLSPHTSAADSTKTVAAAHDTTSPIQSGTGSTPAAGAGATDTSKFSKEIADSATKSSVRAGGDVPSKKPLSDQLSDLLSAADDPDSSSIVLARLARLEAGATGSKDIRLVATLRAKVAAAKGDNGKACDELKKAVPKVNAADLESLRSRAAVYDGCRLE